jgi:hypothetical protein
MMRASAILLLTLLIPLMGCHESTKPQAAKPTATVPPIIKAAATPAAPAGKLAMAKGTPTDPVPVPFVAEIKVDGDGSEWAKVPAMPLPYMKKDTSSLKLCWNAKGLYGFATLKTAKIPPSSDTPWGGDCVEVWLEKDFVRVADADETDHATQYAFAPNPDSAKGESTCVIAWGKDSPAALKSAWKKTDGGFTIEFFIPVESLAPAKMKAGTKVGMNFSVDVAGKAIEEFYHDKDMDAGYRSPGLWGAAILTE